ncbi:hypothetical protein K440DRAFT_644688 [Wilcoxina mikolae CBS 423.85]|nr:hypothetical protein K440DRAFT_644688 [Wilcoxina mikolae CBS 423.85]
MSATERLVHATLMESYVDNHGTARSTLLLTMEERFQLEYMKIKDTKELWKQLAVDYKSKVKRLVQDWNLCIVADEADTAEDDGKVLTVRQRKKATIMPDAEHIFNLLYGIPDNNDWKIFLEFIEVKDTDGTMWPTEVITKMLECEEKLKQEKDLGYDTLLFAKKGQGRGIGKGRGIVKGKGKGKDNKGNGKF